MTKQFCSYPQYKFRGNHESPCPHHLSPTSLVPEFSKFSCGSLPNFWIEYLPCLDIYLKSQFRSTETNKQKKMVSSSPILQGRLNSRKFSLTTKTIKKKEKKEKRTADKPRIHRKIQRYYTLRTPRHCPRNIFFLFSASQGC